MDIAKLIMQAAVLIALLSIQHEIGRIADMVAFMPTCDSTASMKIEHVK